MKCRMAMTEFIPLVLKFDDWPEADRIGWNALFATGDIFDEAGPCQGWADGSRRKRLQGYGQWLSFLKRDDPEALQINPIDRITEPRVRAYPEEVLPLSKGTVQIQCVTLPHHRKMSKAAWGEIGGPEGHVKAQGLYIYRADRLIIAGGWLGLARQTELTKLCRVRVDIPNSMDADWKIDVQKASAQLPPWYACSATPPWTTRHWTFPT